MKNHLAFILIANILLISCDNKQDGMDNGLVYPAPYEIKVVNDYFGHKVPDPYNWLEDYASERTTEWISMENKITHNYLSKIPYREKIRDRLVDIWNYPKEMEPWKKGDKYFYFKNDGLQNQNVLYYKTSLDGEEIELLDLNDLEADTSLFLSYYSVSDDGRYLGFALSKPGSDWQEIYIKDIENGNLIDEGIKWAKFTEISWYKEGFFYSGHYEPGRNINLLEETTNCKVFYHKFGTPQTDDLMIYENRDEPEIAYETGVTHSKKYLYLYLTRYSMRNALYVKDLRNENSPFIKIVEGADNFYYVVGEIGNYLYVYTNYEAPNFRVVRININRPQRENWEDFIAESNDVLYRVNYVGNRFIASYMRNAYSKIKIFDNRGRFLHDLDQNSIGTIGGFEGEPQDNITFYSVTSFTSPLTIYKYDITNNVSTLYKAPEININPDEYETKQVFYESKDGTKVPMFIVHKKGIKLDGNNPTMLHAYGGFGFSYTPTFDISRYILLEQGGIFAQANIRGGGEYGEMWHKSGTRMNKQNTFDDFIAAAEYLINEKYTSPEKLAIQGTSNGGLLIGAVTNQRPDLFAVALPTMGIMDMLRYHLFTIGRFWASDYGTSNESEEMFKYLYSYSPMHNISPDIEYPAVYAKTSIYDDRVVPLHSFKYIATLQNTYKGKNPILINIDTISGNVVPGYGGAGNYTRKDIHEAANMYSFTFFNMDFTPSYE